MTGASPAPAAQPIYLVNQVGLRRRRDSAMGPFRLTVLLRTARSLAQDPGRRCGVGCHMQQTPQAGTPRRVRVAWLLLMLPLLLVIAAGHLPGMSSKAGGAASLDRAQAPRSLSVESSRSPAGVTVGAAPVRAIVSSSARTAASGRAQAHDPSAPAAFVSGRTDRTVGKAGPTPAWAPEVARLATAPLLPGQLARPPTATFPRTDLAAPRGRAPPGPAGT